MEINEKVIKIWSTIGPRAAFGMAALDFAKEYENLIILTCDVSTSAGLDRYRKTYPLKYLDLGIAEQNMMGVAAGLASENYNVVTTTFAPFQTMRCCEQVKVNFGYMKNKVCMVGIASGLVLGTLGYTHCCIEDLGVLRSIPGITILSPADSLETIKCIKAGIENKNPTYVRLTGAANNPIVYAKDYDFEIGKSIKLKDGKDITIFCTGSMVSESLKSASILEKFNINPSVINIHTIKPIDKSAVNQACKNSKIIVSVEEHNVIGGLGSAIAEVKSQIENSPKHLILGIKDLYGKGGSYNFLKKKHRLTAELIAEDIKNIYDKK